MRASPLISRAAGPVLPQPCRKAEHGEPPEVSPVPEQKRRLLLLGNRACARSHDVLQAGLDYGSIHRILRKINTRWARIHTPTHSYTHKITESSHDFEGE